MYVSRNGRAPAGRARPLSLGDFWGDLFAKQPQVVVNAQQRAIMSRWPESAKVYRTADLIPFLTKIIIESQAALAKTADVTSRRSIGPFGPSKELLDKIQGIETEMAKLAVKMGKRAQFAKAKAKEGFTAVEFPDLRKDAFALMSLTYSLDFLVELEGGPSWIGSGMLFVVDAFTKTGAWLIDTGAKIAKPLLALLSSGDLIIVGGLGLLGLWWWRKGRQR